MPDQTKTSAPYLTLSLDMEKYLGQIDDWAISEEQKREFIETLWGLLVTFAELGFEMSPVEQAQKACGQVENDSRNVTLTAPDTLYCKDRLVTDNFSGRANTSEVSKETS